MVRIFQLSFPAIIILGYFFLLTGVASADDAVSFSGIVKKIFLGKNKVGIKDPDTKKRFTVIVNEKTHPGGLKTLRTLKKKDEVEGKYTVTKKGLYVALELVKK